jgi:hypothetical protein
MKKLTVHTALMLVILIAFVFYLIISINKIDVSKTVALEVTQDVVVDYRYIEKYEAWFSEGRKEMAEYMKKNNFKLKDGIYHFKQSISFDDALKIFKFDEIE